MDKKIARAHLKAILQRVVDELPEYMPALKAVRRDKREPGKDRKEKFEAKLSRIVSAHFNRQHKKIIDRLVMTYPGRKAIAEPIYYDDLGEDNQFEADLIVLLTEAAKDGIDLFSRRSLIGIDYTLVNTAAAEWARKYAGLLIKQIDGTTLDAVRQAIQEFAETPGMTIGDVIKQLPFDEARAQSVAITEITRSYAEANRLSGLQLQKEFPDVRVTKTWFTNNDDRVCPICAPLNGMEVDIDAGFTTGEGEGLDAPPAHVNCRCWMDTRTRI